MPLRGIERKQAKLALKNADLDNKRRQAELDDYMTLRTQRMQSADLANRTVIEAGRAARNNNLLMEGQRNSLIDGSSEATRGSRLANDSSQVKLDLEKKLFDSNVEAGKLLPDEYRSKIGLTKAQATDIPAARANEQTKLLGDAESDRLRQQTALRGLELQGEDVRARNNALELEKRAAVYQAAGVGGTALEKGRIAQHLGQPEMASSFHPSFALSPDQIKSAQSVGISYKPDGSIDTTQLDTSAKQFAKDISRAGAHRFDNPPAMEDFAANLEKFATLYGDSYDNLPGMSAPVRTDLNDFARKYRDKKFKHYSDRAKQTPDGQAMLNSGILGYLANKK